MVPLPRWRRSASRSSGRRPLEGVREGSAQCVCSSARFARLLLHGEQVYGSVFISAAEQPGKRPYYRSIRSGIPHGCRAPGAGSHGYERFGIAASGLAAKQAAVVTPDYTHRCRSREITGDCEEATRRHSTRMDMREGDGGGVHPYLFMTLIVPSASM